MTGAQNRINISSSAQNRLKIGSSARIGSKSAQNRIPESAQNRLNIGSKSDPDSVGRTWILCGDKGAKHPNMVRGNFESIQTLGMILQFWAWVTKQQKSRNEATSLIFPFTHLQQEREDNKESHSQHLPEPSTQRQCEVHYCGWLSDAAKVEALKPQLPSPASLHKAFCHARPGFEKKLMLAMLSIS